MSKRSQPKRARNVPLVAAALATLAALVVLAILQRHGTTAFARLEGATVDARFQLRGERAPATDSIVVVGIDDATRAVAPELMQTRNGWVTFLDKLTAYDPQVIALDLFFSSPEIVLPDDLAKQTLATQSELLALPAPQPDAVAHARDNYAAIADLLHSDDHLAAAIARSHRVYLGAFLYGDPPTAPTTPLVEPPGLARAHHGEVADANAGGTLRPATTAYANYTLDAIATGAVGGGIVNRIEDPDGKIRRVPLAVLYDTRVYMPLGLAVALAGEGHPGDTRYVVGDDHMVAGGKSIALGKTAAVTLDVLGKQKFPRISAADIWTGKTPKAALAHKLVFVGFTYAAFDKFETSFDSKADGVELHATLAENILADRLFRERSGIVTLLVAALLGAIVTLAQLRRIRRHPWAPPLLAIVGGAVYLVLSYVLFTRGIVVDITAPLLAMGAILLVATITNLVTEGREKAQLRAVFGQYVSRAVVDRIVADPARAKLGGERKDLTVLFSDIRGFSLFSEGMAPEELAQLLSDYLTPMTDLVLESSGTLDKYIGDAVMAIWGAPVELPDHAPRACEVALRMQEVLVELNKKWVGSGRPELAIGIGLNTGPMAVGNMGTIARFDYTVLGDHVNLASRLEALTKEYGVAILVGEGTMRAAGDRFVFREVDLVRVKGRAGAAPVYELVGRAATAKVDPAFAEGLALYRRREFAQARTRFASLENDKVAKILATRCERLLTEPPPADWDGVYDQRSK